MKVVGIIAEYNPFHNGHAYQIRYAKEELGADYVIVAMSGPFTQRGTPACFDKYTRASHALSCGADLVFELPALYATASAQLFATGGVCLLQNTGVVDTLLFGSETEDLTTLKQIAQLLNKEDDTYQEQLRLALQTGKSFAAARTEALGQDTFSTILSQPNNILAIEYLKALQQLHSTMIPLCLKRNGADYHNTDIHTNHASATAIRSFIADHSPKKQQDLSILLQQIPEVLHTSVTKELQKDAYLLPEDISLLLQYALSSHDDFTAYSDCSFDISNKILQKLHLYAGYHSFCMQLKSKDVAYSRISRVLCHILLDIKKSDFTSWQPDLASTIQIPYLRLLGFNEHGSSLLSTIKKESQVPILTTPKNAEQFLSPMAYSMLQKDIFAADVYRMILSQKTGIVYPNEYTRKFKKHVTD